MTYKPVFLGERIARGRSAGQLSYMQTLMCHRSDPCLWIVVCARQKCLKTLKSLLLFPRAREVLERIRKLIDYDEL